MYCELTIPICFLDCSLNFLPMLPLVILVQGNGSPDYDYSQNDDNFGSHGNFIFGQLLSYCFLKASGRDFYGESYWNN